MFNKNTYKTQQKKKLYSPPLLYLKKGGEKQLIYLSRYTKPLSRPVTHTDQFSQD